MTAVATALAQVAVAVEDRVDPVASQIAIALHREITELPGDDASVQRTRRACADSLRVFLDGLAHGTAIDQLDVPPANLSAVRALAHSSSSPGPVMRMLHVAHATIFELWDEAIASVPMPDDIAPAVRREAHDRLFEWVGIMTGHFSSEFESERRRWSASADALRAETVEELLAGGPVDAVAASRTLNYDLNRHHAAFLLAEPSRACALELAAAVGDRHPLILGARMWAGGHRLPDLDALGAMAEVSVAVGEPAHGVDGFRTSTRDAASAAAVAAAARRRPGAVTRFRSVEVGALLAGDLDRARRFVQRELGGLAGDDDESARLRATLQVYLAESFSRQATAARLGIHNNTVANRVRRCRELLGHNFNERHAPLVLALELAATLGAVVTDRSSSR